MEQKGRIKGGKKEQKKMNNYRSGFNKINFF